MTYNIRGGLGIDGRRDTARIAAVVSAEQPDIICYQELHRRLPWSGWDDQPGRLQKLTTLSVVFQANVRFGLGGYGVGIAARGPIRRVRRHRLPSMREARGVLEAEVETPNGPLTVFCTHWGLSQEERRKQAQATVSLLNAAKTPVIFCGDLNERPEADYIVAMREQAHLDDWGAVTALPTYPSDTPSARIDVLFASPALRLKRFFVADTEASDHRPVIADFGVTTK